MNDLDRDLVAYRQNVLVHSWSRSGDPGLWI